jgi:hypothetical protein
VPSRQSNRTIGPSTYVLVCAVGTVIALIVGYYLLTQSRLGLGETTEKRGYYVLLILLGMAGCALVFGAMQATASFTGKQFGAALDLGGPAVALFLLPFLGFYLTQPPMEFDLTVNVRGLRVQDDINQRIRMVVDVESRREILQFTPSAQATIRALPYRMRGKKAAIEFTSDAYVLSTGQDLSVAMAEPFVVTIQVTRVADDILRRRHNKVQLAEKFERVIREIDESLMQREGRLFPAFERFNGLPSRENWAEVLRAAQEALRQIEHGVQSARDHDSALAITADELLRLISAAPVPPNRPLAGAAGSWTAKGVILGALPTEPPTREDALVWERALRGYYAELQRELQKLRQQLASSL